MPKPPIPDELVDFLERPNPSVIATLQPDGAPHTAATWYLWEGGRVLVNMDESRKRVDHLRRDPHVSLTVLGGDDWYHHVTLRGHVAALEPDAGLSAIDRLSRHYTGQAYSNRDNARVSAWIELDSWHAWGGGRTWSA